MSHYQWQGDNLILHCYLQPRASRDEIVGVHAGALKIRLTAPPVDGAANLYLQQWLAKTLGVAKSAVSLQKGHSGRQKTLCIESPKLLPVELAVLAHPSRRNPD